MASRLSHSTMSKARFQPLLAARLLTVVTCTLGVIVSSLSIDTPPVPTGLHADDLGPQGSQSMRLRWSLPLPHLEAARTPLFCHIRMRPAAASAAAWTYLPLHAPRMIAEVQTIELDLGVPPGVAGTFALAITEHDRPDGGGLCPLTTPPIPLSVSANGLQAALAASIIPPSLWNITVSTELVGGAGAAHPGVRRWLIHFVNAPLGSDVSVRAPPTLLLDRVWDSGGKLLPANAHGVRVSRTTVFRAVPAQCSLESLEASVVGSTGPQHWDRSALQCAHVVAGLIEGVSVQAQVLCPRPDAATLASIAVPSTGGVSGSSSDDEVSMSLAPIQLNMTALSVFTTQAAVAFAWTRGDADRVIGSVIMTRARPVYVKAQRQVHAPLVLQVLASEAVLEVTVRSIAALPTIVECELSDTTAATEAAAVLAAREGGANEQEPHAVPFGGSRFTINGTILTVSPAAPLEPAGRETAWSILFSLKPLPPRSSFAVRVRMAGEWSPPTSFSTPAVAASVVTPQLGPVARSDVQHDRVTVRWADSNVTLAGLVGYTLQVQALSGPGAVASSGSGSGRDSDDGWMPYTAAMTRAQLAAAATAGAVAAGTSRDEDSQLPLAALISSAPLLYMNCTGGSAGDDSSGSARKAFFAWSSLPYFESLLHDTRAQDAQLSVPTPPGGAGVVGICSYVLTVASLSPSTLYRFRLRAVTAGDTAAFILGDYSAPSPRVRTRALPAVLAAAAAPPGIIRAVAAGTGVVGGTGDDAGASASGSGSGSGSSGSSGSSRVASSAVAPDLATSATSRMLLFDLKPLSLGVCGLWEDQPFSSSGSSSSGSSSSSSSSGGTSGVDSGAYSATAGAPNPIRGCCPQCLISPGRRSRAADLDARWDTARGGSDDAGGWNTLAPDWRARDAGGHGLIIIEFHSRTDPSALDGTLAGGIGSAAGMGPLYTVVIGYNSSLQRDLAAAAAAAAARASTSRLSGPSGSSTGDASGSAAAAAPEYGGAGGAGAGGAYGGAAGAGLSYTAVTGQLPPGVTGFNDAAGWKTFVVLPDPEPSHDGGSPAQPAVLVQLPTHLFTSPAAAPRAPTGPTAFSADPAAFTGAGADAAARVAVPTRLLVRQGLTAVVRAWGGGGGCARARTNAASLEAQADLEGARADAFATPKRCQPGGNGAFVRAAVPVTSHQDTFAVFVGSGGKGTYADAPGRGGWPGGGSGGRGALQGGAGGGGASLVYKISSSEFATGQASVRAQLGRSAATRYAADIRHTSGGLAGGAGGGGGSLAGATAAADLIASGVRPEDLTAGNGGFSGVLAGGGFLRALLHGGEGAAGMASVSTGSSTRRGLGGNGGSGSTGSSPGVSGGAAPQLLLQLGDIRGHFAPLLVAAGGGGGGGTPACCASGGHGGACAGGAGGAPRCDDLGRAPAVEPDQGVSNLNTPRAYDTAEDAAFWAVLSGPRGALSDLFVAPGSGLVPTSVDGSGSGVFVNGSAVNATNSSSSSGSSSSSSGGSSIEGDAAAFAAARAAALRILLSLRSGGFGGSSALLPAVRGRLLLRLADALSLDATSRAFADSIRRLTGGALTVDASEGGAPRLVPSANLTDPSITPTAADTASVLALLSGSDGGVWTRFRFGGAGGVSSLCARLYAATAARAAGAGFPVGGASLASGGGLHSLASTAGTAGNFSFSSGAGSGGGGIGGGAASGADEYPLGQTDMHAAIGGDFLHGGDGGSGLYGGGGGGGGLFGGGGGGAGVEAGGGGGGSSYIHPRLLLGISGSGRATTRSAAAAAAATAAAEATGTTDFLLSQAYRCPADPAFVTGLLPSDVSAAGDADAAAASAAQAGGVRSTTRDGAAAASARAFGAPSLRSVQRATVQLTWTAAGSWAPVLVGSPRAQLSFAFVEGEAYELQAAVSMDQRPLGAGLGANAASVAAAAAAAATAASLVDGNVDFVTVAVIAASDARIAGGLVESAEAAAASVSASGAVHPAGIRATAPAGTMRAATVSGLRPAALCRSGWPHSAAAIALSSPASSPAPALLLRVVTIAATGEHSLPSPPVALRGEDVMRLCGFSEALPAWRRLSLTHYDWNGLLTVDRETMAARQEGPERPPPPAQPAEPVSPFAGGSSSAGISAGSAARDASAFSTQGTAPLSSPVRISAPSHPPPLRGSSLVAVGRHLYLFGGLVAGEDCSGGAMGPGCSAAGVASAALWRYTPDTGAWRLLHPGAGASPFGWGVQTAAPLPRERHSAVSMPDGNMYIFGGRSHPDYRRDGGGYLGDTWRWEVNDTVVVDTWRGDLVCSLAAGAAAMPPRGAGTAADMPVRCYSVAAAAALLSGDGATAAVNASTAAAGYAASSAGQGGRRRIVAVPIPEDGPLFLPVPVGGAAVEGVAVVTAPGLESLASGSSSAGNSTSGSSSTAAAAKAAAAQPQPPADFPSNPSVEWEGVGAGMCVEDVEVSLVLLHPCLRDLTISLAGPSGPLFRPARMSAPSTTENVGRFGDALSTASFALLFAGGAGAGSAGPDYVCSPADSAAMSALSQVRGVSAAEAAATAPSTTPGGFSTSGGIVRLAPALPHGPVSFADGATAGVHRCCAPASVDSVLLEETWSAAVPDPTLIAPDGTAIAPRLTTLRGRFKPLSSLRKRFRGGRARGAWTIRVHDRRANGFTGAVLDWSVTTHVRPCSPEGRWRQLALPPPIGAAEAAAFAVPAPRADAVSAVYNGAWYIWGGHSHLNPLYAAPGASLLSDDGGTWRGSSGSGGAAGGSAGDATDRRLPRTAPQAAPGAWAALERVWRFEPEKGQWTNLGPLRPPAQAAAAGLRLSYAHAVISRLFSGRFTATSPGAGGACVQDAAESYICWRPSRSLAPPGRAARSPLSPSAASELVRWDAVRQEWNPIGAAGGSTVAAHLAAAAAAAAAAPAPPSDSQGLARHLAFAQPGHRSLVAMAVFVGPTADSSSTGADSSADSAAGSNSGGEEGGGAATGTEGQAEPETLYMYGGIESATGVVLGDLWAMPLRRQ